VEQDELLNCCYEYQVGNWKCDSWGKEPKWWVIRSWAGMCLVRQR